METGDVYTRADGKEYIRDWWKTDKYHHLVPVIQTYIGVNPDGHEGNPKYQLIKVIYNTRVKNNPGWYWAITKQNLLDIDREYNLWQNNLNNRLTNNNRRKYNNIKIDSYSGYSTDDTTKNQHSWFDDWIKQNQLQRQQTRYMRKDMENCVIRGLKRFDQNINSAIQKYDDLSSWYNGNSLVRGVGYNDSMQYKNNSNNNLRSNIRANRKNQNNNRRRESIDLNNIFANNNNNNQIQQSRNHSYDDRGINNKINFNNSWIEQAEYKDLVKAIKKYSKMKPDGVDSEYEKQFVKVLQNERVSCDKMGWWFDIDGDKFAKIKKAYDLLHNRRVVNNRYNANNHQYNKKCKKYMADYEARGVDGDNQIIAYNLNHRMSKQYCNDSINRKNAAGYTMGLYTTNINGINDSIHV